MAADSRETPLLKMRSLTKEFGAMTAVDGVDLTVEEGELHAIIGPNGAGKTTLFNMIAGTLQPSRGRVYLRGEDVTRTSTHDRSRQGISRAFQITQLFPEMTIVENLQLGALSKTDVYNPFDVMDESVRERAMDMFAEMDIDADVSTPAKVLSHGDKKKLEIGMTLLTDPDLLLLDEPTSGVSEDGSQHLIDQLKRVTRGLTVVLIEHDVDMVLRMADRITVLHQGAVIARGLPEEVTGSEDVQRAYLGDLA